MPRPLVLVTGAQGQVGIETVRRAHLYRLHPIGLSSTQLDITSSESVTNAISAYHPDIVINCAAFTAVDQAETQVAQAFAVNEGGVQHIARACAAAAIPLCHISTDYVYDGLEDDPCLEEDTTCPTSVYGRSKLAGEHAIADELTDYIILRTAWVYATHGRNFLRTMLRLADTRDGISVVDDQYGTPTFAGDIADTLLIMASRVLFEKENTSLYGIFNYSGKGRATWFEFAKTIFDARHAITGHRPVLSPIPTSAYETPAARPQNSVLDCSLIEQIHGIRPIAWQSRVKEITQKILMQRNTGFRKTDPTDGGTT